MANVSEMPLVDLRRYVGDARSARLRHVSDDAPGIRRRRCGAGFMYIHIDGKRVADDETLDRIRRLAIPPAYERVWICALADGHLQATGYDAAGRKQYRYHPRWQAVRSLTKYTHMIDFASALPALRRRVDLDLKCRGLECRRVLATAVRVLDATLIRVGNERYTARNGSYGLTTLQNRHVKIDRDRVSFRFIGKSKQLRQLQLDDPVLAKILRSCRDLPGHRLFEYVDPAGAVLPIGSADVNDYIHAVTGHALTAKDFRTWGGTVHAAVFLSQVGPASSATAAERNIVAAIKAVAVRLGNRPATSRKYYVHPAVLDAYRDETLGHYIDFKPRIDRPARRGSLLPEEKAVLALLRDRAEPARGRRRLAA